jgi:LPXTG-motif cell wall-anchored protein
MTLSDNTHCASSFTAGHTAYAPMTDSDNPTRRYFDKPTAIIGVEGISLGVSALGDIYSNDITTLASGMALADPIAVFWQTSDIAEVFPSAYAASVARQVAATEVSSSQTTGASPSSKSNLATQTGTSTADPADRSSNDLSTGAKAGIAIGVVLGVALVALGVLLLFRRRRKQKLARDTPVGQVPEMGDTGHGKRLMGGQWRAEAQAEEKAQELDSRGVHVMNDFPVEIDSSGRTPDARHM